MEWRLRHPGGMRAEVSEENGMSVGYDCAEISGWNGGCETSRENGMSAGWNGG